jgi:lipopolysaccharide assembly outer membrane protein LptD (OstA)
MKKRTFLPILICLISIHSYSQSRLELLHADISRGVVRNDIPMRILEGNVHARQDTLELFCDLATWIESKRTLILENNVELRRGGDTLTAKKITYHEDQQIAIAERNVHLWRAGQELFTEYLRYYYQTDQSFANNGVRILDNDNRVTITAKKGEYLPEQDRAYVKERAHLVRLDSAGTDTLHIYARRMDYYFSPAKRAVAVDSVRIVRENLTAKCDSAVYQVDAEKAFLEISPQAFQENSEMVGRQMEMIFENMEIRRIVVRENAIATSIVDSVAQKQNRLTGREIIMYITDRQLHELRAISNATSNYYLKEEQEEKGLNVASADTIKVFFKNSELDSIDVKGGSQGIYYPVDYKGKIDLEY